MFCQNNNIIIITDNEVTEHESDISLDGWQSLWAEPTVTESKEKKKKRNAAVTEQKSAQSSAVRAEQELPLVSDQSQSSSSRVPAHRGGPDPDNRLAFTESTT